MSNSATILGGVGGTSLTADEAAFFREADPWGFILFGRNVDAPGQLRRLTGDLRDAVGRDCVITVDQEGGRVQRLRAPHWTEWPAPLDDARAGSRAMWLRYHLIGQELRAVGIDSNCAPTLDLAQEGTHPFLRNRCLGTEPSRVACLGRSAAEGMLAAGVLPVVKHMPGHGGAQVDSHLELPVVDAPLAQLEARDFAAFRALADLPMGMTAHIRFTTLDDAPATASARVIGLIRQSIGFDGLLMTDDITMQALSGTEADRASASVAAGCDLVLHCNGTVASMGPVVEAAGRMTSDAIRRGAAALALRRPPARTDLDALKAEWQALTAA